MRNLKKVIALVAVFAMMVSTVAFAQTFTDVADDHDYYEAIEMLSSLEILTGDDQDGDGKVDFRPNDTITRAEVAAIVSRIQGINSAAQTATEFVDVPSSHWASGYVAQAAGQGIVNGYGDGNFGPEDPVLYEQAVKMLVETLGYAPFVSDNGGYPTGHLTAASRYGVLDGVVGGAQGAQATRGMVAQMVYNAIDTPLMDRWTYGADAEYVIYNGKGDYDYVSLLNRDLGVKKFTGIVTQNQVTSLTDAVDIETDEETVIEVSYDNTDDYWNYDCDEIRTLYEGDSNAGDFLGMHVSMYVKETGRKGDYEVISAAATNKNKTVEFDLDQYANVADGYVEYYKNSTDRTTTKLKLEAYGTETVEGTTYRVSGYDVIYNNVAVDEDTYTLSYLLDKKEAYSGKVTLVDNDSTSGYDVVFVEIGAPAVVDEVSASGKISFKEKPENSIGLGINLYVDEEATNRVVKIMKDGVEIDYTELKEWDVLSIVYNGINDQQYYVANVLESSTVEGTISGATSSTTSASGQKYDINGTKYDVAANAYLNGKLSVGASGLFYIDEYGKIVAYDKNGTTTASDKYGYILDSKDTIDSWDKENVNILILDKTGGILQTNLASSIKLENASADLEKALGGEKNSYKLEDITKKSAMKTLADALKNQLVTFEVNGSNEVKTITFAQDDEEDGTLWLAANGLVTYDEEDMELEVAGTKFDVTEETIVYFINGDSVIKGLEDKTNVGDKSTSKVGTIANVAEITASQKLNAAVYDADDDVPAVLVLWNTTGGVSPASNIAVIDEVGKAYVDGDDVVSVSFYMGGELKQATTSPDMVSAQSDALSNAEAGDIFKLGLAGDVIVEARLYGSYSERADEDWDAAAGLTIADTVLSGNNVVFGPVIDYSSSNKRIRIAESVYDEDGKFTGYDLTKAVNIKANNAFVYVYDPVKKDNKVYVGDANDVDFNDDVTEKDVFTNTDEVTYVGRPVIMNKKTVVEAGVPALGMMDFVAAVEYDGDYTDVVIYKAYDFTVYQIGDLVKAAN